MTKDEVKCETNNYNLASNSYITSTRDVSDLNCDA